MLASRNTIPFYRMSLVESLGHRMQEAGIPTSEAVLIVTAALDDADERWRELIDREHELRTKEHPSPMRTKSREDEALDILVAIPATASAIKH